MTDTPEPVAWLYTFANDPEHREVKIERYALEYAARVGLTETPLYTRPDADIVRLLVEAAERILERGYVSSCIEEERDDHDALVAALAAAADAMEVGDAG